MSCAAQRGKFPPWTGAVAATVAAPAPQPVRAVDAGKFADIEVGLDMLEWLLKLSNDKRWRNRRIGALMDTGDTREILEHLIRRLPTEPGSVCFGKFMIVAEFEKALAAEYRRGVEDAGCWKDSC